ncbi:MAG TPA: low specificity L-threonine aldolase [Methylocella sp.]|nr:low specificity L-threonine aldolase [Methylocella sp.]
MNFASDNSCGVSEPILAALTAANKGALPAYGADPFTAKAGQLLKEIFEHDLAYFLVSTGTAANALALVTSAPAYGAIFCHVMAHITTDECGAPEMFTGGTKLIGIRGKAGKIAPADLRSSLAALPRGGVHHVQPAVLSLSQVTECGTVYGCDEIAELARLAHDAGLIVHMDGARFANALVSLGCTPAEMSWKAGVDVLSFGATKNGALACEAIIIFDPAKALSLPYWRKRSGHTLSKGRYLGAQMAAYLDHGHWLALAKQANGWAGELAAGLAKISGIRMPWPCQANEVFAVLPGPVDRALRACGAVYYSWPFPQEDPGVAAPGEDEVFVRLVASFATIESEVMDFLAVAREAAARGPQIL